MVSASTLIGPFEFDRALATRPLLTCDRAVNNGRVPSARSNSIGLGFLYIHKLSHTPRIFSLGSLCNNLNSLTPSTVKFSIKYLNKITLVCVAALSYAGNHILPKYETRTIKVLGLIRRTLNYAVRKLKKGHTSPLCDQS